MPKEDTQESVTNQLVKLNKNLQLSNNYKQIFLRGIVSGLGTAVGATLMAAVLITTFLKLVQVTGIEKWIPENFLADLKAAE